MRNRIFTANGLLIGLVAIMFALLLVSRQGQVYGEAPKPAVLELLSWSVVKSGTSANSNRPRFVYLEAFNNEAVLDLETQLVWEVRPSTPFENTLSWEQARFSCIDAIHGNRMGWRLPTTHELATLLDQARASSIGPPPPTLNAFPLDGPIEWENLVNSGALQTNGMFWSSTTVVKAGTTPDNLAYAAAFGSIDAGFTYLRNKDSVAHCICVRGPGGVGEVY
jgi:hypothetical protein